MLRVLVLSDVSSWDGFKRIFVKVNPNVLLLGGDLTSDGTAEFWHRALYSIEEFRVKVAELERRYKCIYEALLPDYEQRVSRIWVSNYMTKTCILLGSTSFTTKFGHELHLKYHKELDSIEARYRKSSEFQKNRWRMHVDKFYDVLEYASEICQVFVVKGDHDDDFEGDYDFDKINSIKNCEEISGKVVEYKNLRFLGLGFRETHYLRVLRPIIDSVHADIVLTHAEQRRLPLITKIKPKIIFGGHFGIGKYFVDEVPVVSTNFPGCYAIIDIENAKVREVITKIYCSKSKKWQKCNLSCKYTPELVKANRKLWPWMKRLEELCPLILKDKRKIE